MRRPPWTWRGYLPRPPDDGRCAVWGGACVERGPRVWWPGDAFPLCPTRLHRCLRSDADHAARARRLMRAAALLFGGVVIVTTGDGTP